MTDIRTGHLTRVDGAFTDAPRHEDEEQVASPRSPSALAQGPAELTPRRGASPSGSLDLPMPDLPRLRVKPPSHWQEVVDPRLTDAALAKTVPVRSETQIH